MAKFSGDWDEATMGPKPSDTMQPGEYTAIAEFPGQWEWSEASRTNATKDTPAREMFQNSNSEAIDWSWRASARPTFKSNLPARPVSNTPIGPQLAQARPVDAQGTPMGRPPQRVDAQGTPVGRPAVDPTKQMPTRAEYNAINPMGRTDLTPDQIRLRRAFTNPNMRNTLSGAQKKAIGAELGFENQEFSRRQVEQSTLDRQKAYADALQKKAETDAGGKLAVAKERTAAMIRIKELGIASNEKIKGMDVDLRTRLAEAKQTGDYKLATDLETQRQEGRIELARREGRDVTTDEFWQKEASDIKEEIAKGEIKKSTDLFDRRAASKQAILNNENMSKDQQNVAIAKLDKAYDEMSQTINTPTSATPETPAAGAPAEATPAQGSRTADDDAHDWLKANKDKYESMTVAEKDRYNAIKNKFKKTHPNVAI